MTSRTLIGLEDRRRVVLATVDRSTVGAVAVLARDFGVWDAVNLDGGGSDDAGGGWGDGTGAEERDGAGGGEQFGGVCAAAVSLMADGRRVG